MKINMDLHIHSEFSCDSDSSIRDICLTALEKGIEYLCITDHVDHNPNDFGCGYYKAEEYLTAIEKYKAEFQGELTLLSGLEFSEPHIYPKEFNRIKSLGYDMITGSIHWLGDIFIGQRKMHELDLLDVQKRYFEALLDMIRSCDIDVVAHLDRPKIVMGRMSLIEEYADKIILALISNETALEINTGAYRKGWSGLMPCESFIRNYIKAGGDKVIIGSDAHSPEEIGSGYQFIYNSTGDELARCLGYFAKRNFSRVGE